MTDDLNISIEVKTGKIFELARKELGLTKSEVSEATFMNIGYVNAIESGDYSIFPSEGFAKAYFIKYQNFLSLECEFPPIYNDKNRQEEIINKSIAKINPSIYPIIRVTGIFIIVVVIIFFININFLNKTSENDLETIIEATVVNSIKEEVEEVASINNSIPDESNIIEKEPPTSKTSNKLMFSFFDECWIEIYSYEELIVSKLFKYGDNFDLEIERPFKVVVGNAEALEATYNGNSIDFIANANRLNVSTVLFNDE